MDFCGEVVRHKVFGKGKVIEFKDNNVTILFEYNNEEKKFIYPSAFETFLEVESKSFFIQIQEDKNVIIEMDAEKNRIKDEIEKQNQVIIKPKIAKKSFR